MTLHTTIETMLLGQTKWTREAGFWIAEVAQCDITLNWASPAQFTGVVYHDDNIVAIRDHNTTPEIQRTMEGVMLELVSLANSFVPTAHFYSDGDGFPYGEEYGDDGGDMYPDSRWIDSAELDYDYPDAPHREYDDSDY